MHPLWPAVFSSVAMCQFGGYISQFYIFVVSHLFDFDAMRSEIQIVLEVVNVHVTSKIFVGINLGVAEGGGGGLGWIFLKNGSWWVHYWAL